MNEKLLTTKELASAIGVSESSLRRWTDSGVIRTSKTVGGHRRIVLSEAIRFIRETHATLVRPEVLGFAQELTPRPAGGAGGVVGEEEPLFDALRAGDAARCRSILLGLFLGGVSPASIFDGPLNRAMQRVGSLWEHDGQGILVEHRASDICLQVVSELRRLLPPPADDAPVAVGGAPQRDPYILPSAMAAAVLTGEGYREFNFGPDTPVPLLAEAARLQKARLVWLSVSVAPEGAAAAAGLRRDVETLAADLRADDVALVIGGRHASAAAPPARAAGNVHVLRTMAELVAFVRGARPARTLPAV